MSRPVLWFTELGGILGKKILLFLIIIIISYLV
jgi:hypothetical protein